MFQTDSEDGPFYEMTEMNSIYASVLFSVGLGEIDQRGGHKILLIGFEKRSYGFVGLPQPRGEDFHHLHRKAGIGTDQIEKCAFVDRDQGHVGSGDGSRAPRGLIDQRHLAEHIPLFEFH